MFKSAIGFDGGFGDERKIDDLEADTLLIHVEKAIMCSWEYRYFRAPEKLNA